MNISSVSASSYSTITSSTTGTTTVAQVQKKIAVLQQKIQAEMASNDDDTTKQMKIQSYQSQMVVLQTQLTQLQNSSTSKTSS